MPLLKQGKVVDDPYFAASDDEALPPSGPVLVSLDRYLDERDALLARDGALGVRFRSDQSPSLIEDDLPRLALCALEFPAFTDGRAYSYARLLRERYGFEGEVRAVGDVLLEQLHFMDRVGFDAFEIESEHAAEDWSVAQSDMGVWYQPTHDGRKTATRLRRG